MADESSTGLPQTLGYEFAPDYLKAADLHNLANSNESFFSPDYLLSLPGRQAKFTISSVASGINSIYNTGVAIGNWFGADAAPVDTASQLSQFDSDLGSYYEANKAGADIVGFIGTSFVPGIGGVKLFNAGQKALKAFQGTGFVGEGFATVTGLLPTIEQSIAKAGAELAANGQRFTLANANVLAAVGKGFVQNAWEAAAFETMVTATMYKSPVLDGQDWKDISANVLTGAVLGGAIGGILSSASTYGGIKKVITAADLEAKPWEIRSSTAYVQSPSDRIILAANDLAATPSESDSIAKGFLPKREARLTQIAQDIRSNTNELAGNDFALGNIVADTLVGMEADQVSNVMYGASRIRRPDPNLVTPAGETTAYVKLFGEDAGKVSWEPPPVLTLADRLKPVNDGSGNKTMQAAVEKYVDSAKFGTKKSWNMITASSQDEIQARYIWAETKAKYSEDMVIHPTDIPLLEGALKNDIQNIVVDDGIHSYPVNRANLENEILQSKRDLAYELTKAQQAGWIADISKSRIVTSDEIARAVNVSREFLESTEGATIYARQSAQENYNSMLASKGIKRTPEQTNLDYIPQHAAVGYKSDLLAANSSGDLAGALVNIKYQQKVARDAIDSAAIAAMGPELFSQVGHASEKQMLESNRFGAGAGLFSFANGSYGSLASWAEQNGSVTARFIKKLGKDTSDLMDSPMLKLRGNQAAAVEVFDINNQALKASGFDRYIHNDAGDGLILSKMADYKAKVQAGEKGVEVPNFPAEIAQEIKFSSPEVGEALNAMVQYNGRNTTIWNSLRSAEGLEGNRNALAFYPIKPDPKQMPFFAFVKDETVTGAGLGHISMIHAASESQLGEMIKSVQERTGFKVYTKADTENFYKAQKEYEFGKTLHENYIDSSLKSQGVNNYFFPKTDPNKIVDEILDWHRRADSNLARDVMATKLGNEFDQLHTLGAAYTNISSSRYGVTAKSVEGSTKNPYLDYAKTALNISRLSEYPTLVSFNRVLENSVSAVYDRVKNAWNLSKFTPQDLEATNKALADAGIQHSYKDAAEVLLANHSAPANALSGFIRGANSILANTFLRYDPMNALNNAIGANILLSHETVGLLKGIRNGDSSLAGELSQLLDIGVPGTGDVISSPAKLIASVMKDFVSGGSELSAYVKANGWGGRITDLNRAMLEDLTLTGQESGKELTAKLQSAWDKAKVLSAGIEKYSGNQLAEEFNRFVAAGVAKKISDLGVAGGLLDEASQLSYINTFVNRTQGNILASQRPLIFQGPIGQAIGLFQTYQFNVMQQLFRGVAEGGTKDAAMLLGMQGAMYGLNGLPAFQLINQHIVGTASGNKAHTDAYSALYGTLGKTAGDWLMYGIPSNLLQTNLYSRGDINPRRLTVIPTNPADVVAVSAFAKFAANLKETLTKSAGGGDIWQSVLQGLEHNGLSRPLTGLAQTAQAFSNPTGKAFSTTNAGDVSFVNDFVSLATLARLSGGKPLDEALANDELARSNVYKAADKERMKGATEAFKTNVIGNQKPTEDAVKDYLQAWVKNGGRVQDFNKAILTSITKANTPRANEVIRSLKGPYGQHMQNMLGGKLEDFSSD